MQGSSETKLHFLGNWIGGKFAENNFVEQELPSGSPGERMEIGFVPQEKIPKLLVNINVFALALKAFYESVNAIEKRKQVQRIMAAEDWIGHHKDKHTGRRVLSESAVIEYDNEKLAAIRIVGGSHQARRVVLDVRSDIQAKYLVDGLRSGTAKNDLLKEILLFYRGKFYRLPKTLIWSKRSFISFKRKRATREALLKSLSLAN